MTNAGLPELCPTKIIVILAKISGSMWNTPLTSLRFYFPTKGCIFLLIGKKCTSIKMGVPWMWSWRWTCVSHNNNNSCSSGYGWRLSVHLRPQRLYDNDHSQSGPRWQYRVLLVHAGKHGTDVCLKKSESFGLCGWSNWYIYILRQALVKGKYECAWEHNITLY